MVLVPQPQLRAQHPNVVHPVGRAGDRGLLGSEDSTWPAAGLDQEISNRAEPSSAKRLTTSRSAIATRGAEIATSTDSGSD